MPVHTSRVVRDDPVEARMTELGLTCERPILGFTSSRADAGSSASAKRDGYADEEPEVVPVPRIGNFVHAHVVREQGNHERKEDDDPVPETQPEACRLTSPSRRIGAGRA